VLLCVRAPPPDRQQMNQGNFKLGQLPEGTRAVLLNIGSNVSPLQPPRDNSSIISIAFEPVVAAHIRAAPGLYVVPAAVGREAGLAMMRVYRADGQASSFHEPAAGASFKQDARPSQIVPVVSMSMVLNSIPVELLIWYLKTDMQGHDFTAVASAGPALARVPYVMTEVWLERVFSYEGVSNDFCRDWLPHMLALGYEPVSLVGDWGMGRMIYKHLFIGGEKQAGRYCASDAERNASTPRAGKREANAFWAKRGTGVLPPRFLRDKESKLAGW
jgi:hypothetical protein